LYENANVAADHQMLLMEILKSTAIAHGFVCLLHEKPFAGINGSGKHNNWSIATDSGTNLLNPGKEPHAHLQFLTFLCAVVRAVDIHADLLRASIASAANDHRLGANEAPPAIISIYLGEMLSDIFDQIEADESRGTREGGTLDLGTATMPSINRHSGDRNRTSPFAFTGNKFEFRAVGSTSTIAWPNTVMNTIIAESLDYIATQLETTLAGSTSKEQRETAVRSLLKDIVRDHRKVVFDGDNYTEEWHKESAKRGLPNLRTAADAIPVLTTEKSLNLFEHYGVLSNRELKARQEVLLQQYATVVGIECRTLIQMLSTQILPAALRCQGELADIVSSTQAVSVDCSRSAGRLNDVARLVESMQESIDTLKVAESKDHPSSNAHADYVRDSLLPAMEVARVISDQLEEMLPDDLWQLPSYTEMLFVR
ncbi:MAG TPA: glutamine synthetase type III, partial [Phycisphaerales bacterium]|nr:glutamine synthetase type III [Phycisphaerales bacterium]